MEILTFSSGALHKTDQELFFHFYSSLYTPSQWLGKRCRGKNKSLAAILCLQHVTIPKLLTSTWVQLSRSMRPLDFQHTALHSQLTPISTPSCSWLQDPSPCCPLLFISTLFTSCSNQLPRQTHYLLSLRCTSEHLSCTPSSSDNQRNGEIKAWNSTSLIPTFGKAWRDIYTSAWAPVKKCWRLYKLEKHWFTKRKFWLGESMFKFQRKKGIL